MFILSSTLKVTRIFTLAICATFISGLAACNNAAPEANGNQTTTEEMSPEAMDDDATENMGNEHPEHDSEHPSHSEHPSDSEHPANSEHPSDSEHPNSEHPE